MVSGLDPIVFEFVIVLCAAFLATFACQKLKLPPVVGLIFAGLIISPNALGLVGESDLIQLFSEIGAILLLFYVGIEFDFSRLLRVVAKSALFAVAKLVLIFVFLYEVLLVLNFDVGTAVLVAFMMSITSTAIMIRILEQKGYAKREELPVLIAALVIEDIVAIVAITLVSSLGTDAVSLRAGILAMATAMLVLGIAYAGLSRILKRLSVFLDFKENEDLLVFFSLTLCLALSVIAFLLGLSPAIGAFLAGSLISSLNIGPLARKATGSLGLAFSAFFFISIGLLVQLDSILSDWIIMLVLILAQLLAMVVFSFLAARSIGFKPEQAAFSGLALAVSGEFSLLFAKEAARFSSLDLVGLASMSVLATALFSTLLISKNEKLLELFRLVPKRTAKRFSAFFSFTSRIVSNLEYGGRLHKILIREYYERRNDVWKIAGAVILLLGIDFFFPHSVVGLFGYTIPVFYLAVAVVGIVAVYSLVRVLASFLYLLDVFEESILGSQGANYKKFERNIAIALLLSAVFVLLPGVVAVLKLPSAFLWLQSVPLALAIVFVWSAIKNGYAARNHLAE
jgi:CPA2 family monovalent cation:H+ antiporter-2